MGNFFEFLVATVPFIPLFFFILAVTFRLLDNSSLLFLQQDILVNSSNVSRKLLKEQIKIDSDPVFTKRLRRALILRNLQQSFMVSAVVSFPISLVYFLA